MKIRIIVTVAVALALSACATDEPDGPPTVEIKGSDPAASASAAAPADDGSLGTPPVGSAPDSTGIVTYEGYQAAVARDGDTVASVAERVGLSSSELGAYNGLAPAHTLRSGDELVLPPKPGGYDTGVTGGQQIALADTGVQTAPIEGAPSAVPGATDQAPAASWSPDLAAAAIDRSAQPTGLDENGNLALPPSNAEPLPPSPQAPGQLQSPQLRQYQTPRGQPSGQLALATPVEQPAAETAATAPLEPVTELGTEPEPQPAEGQLPLDVTPTEEPDTTKAPVTPTPRPVETITTPSEQVVEPEPQPAAQPEPEPQPQSEPEPEQQVASAPATSGAFRLMRPVSGPIVKRFGQGGGRGSSDGIDFASPAGAPVLAAAGGEVALVSQSLGGLGTIVLVRHQDDYLTVYGRIEKVTVGKGDLVSSGQKIGVVSPSPKPRMHFELRRGAEGLDPETFF
ncbi:MAG: peptidoglycan DD-metalloendopeptidase family protein [Paracoccaceae bacterium]|nr:peptidoglycan DD-metalloendopeptidase family protein [Paracoccaceae bacterium]